MKKIVVFASGGGSSVENLYLYFSKKPNFEVLKLYCNNPEAGVLERNRINSLYNERCDRLAVEASKNNDLFEDLGYE